MLQLKKLAALSTESVVSLAASLATSPTTELDNRLEGKQIHLLLQQTLIKSFGSSASRLVYLHWQVFTWTSLECGLFYTMILQNDSTSLAIECKACHKAKWSPQICYETLIKRSCTLNAVPVLQCTFSICMKVSKSVNEKKEFWQKSLEKRKLFFRKAQEKYLKKDFLFSKTDLQSSAHFGTLYWVYRPFLRFPPLSSTALQRRHSKVILIVWYYVGAHSFLQAPSIFRRLSRSSVDPPDLLMEDFHRRS